MKIYYEDSLPYAEQFFADLAQCQVFSHRTVTADTLADADILLVRSTTKVNEQLLSLNQQLKFVGTATAGTNHMDFDYLQGRGIETASAAGCNAVAVAEYVLSAIFVMAEKLAWLLADKTVGIVGAGHVGSALEQKLKALGIKTLLCDPPLQDKGDPREFVDMQQIMACDVISLHVPLVKDGLYPTAHLFDRNRLATLTADQILINACRGEVLDNQAALSLFKQGKAMNLVLDVWENEPLIDLELVPYVALATAHIAGHTIEGKARGTEMLYHKVCELLNKPICKQLSDYLPVADPLILEISDNGEEQDVIKGLILSVYDIRNDNLQFKASINEPEQFGYIRKNYAIRREFAALQVNAGNFDRSEAIYELGFSPLR
jgi:erythronate-4-phosphate dehydrogenase